MRAIVLSVCVASAALLAFPAEDAEAQAWVGPKGSASASANYSYGASNKIIYEGDLDGAADILLDNHVMVLGATYIPIEHLALDIRVPLMSVKYDAERTFYSWGRYDSGNFHTSLENLHLSGRYQLPVEKVAVALELGGQVPLADYESNGSAGLARGLPVLTAGVHLGWVSQEMLPGLFAGGNYAYNYSPRFETDWEETSDHTQDVSTGSLFAGYYILPDLEAHFASSFRYHHGGIAFADFGSLSAGEENFYNLLIQEKHVNTGIGVGYALNDTFFLNAQFSLVVWGENTTNQKIASVGIDWEVL